MKMRYWIFLFTITAAASCEVTVLDYARIFFVKPDLLFISAVIATLYFEPRWGIFFSILAGIFKDAFSVNPSGFNVLSFALWSMFIIRLSRKVSFENDIFRAVLMFIVVLLNDLVLRRIFFPAAGLIPAGIFMRTVFLESVYSALVMFYGFRPLERLLGSVDIHPKEEGDF